MIWSNDVSFDKLFEIIDKWFDDENNFIGDPPIDAQFALDLIYKTLVDDKENVQYLTTVPESTEQINYIMLVDILYRYSRKYRKYCKNRKKRG